MGRVLRSAGAVLAGIVVGAIVVAAIETVSSKIYALPPGIDPSDTEALKAHMSNLPLGALLLVLLAWAAGSLLGAWVATRLGPSRHAGHGATVGLLLLAAGVANMLLLPHPIWFWAASLVVFPVFTYLGIRLAVGRAASGEPSAPPV